MFARVAAVVLALVALAAGAAGIWALALEQDERNCIAAAEAAYPVKVIPLALPDGLQWEKVPAARIDGEAERASAVEEC